MTYAGVALGRAPGLRIDRAGIALVGASLMIGLGTLSLDDALKAVDLDAIALLLGMMIIVRQLRVSGFFELATRFVLRRAHSAPVLLAAIVIVTGFFSAFLVNDAICLAMAPLVIDVTRALRRDPVPYLLAVTMASNAGSAATFTGNPQNIIIGVTSRLAYAGFAGRLAVGGRFHFDDPWILSGVTALLSNLVSNVPAVSILKPFVLNLPDPGRAWRIAMSSAFAGNLTLIGSAASLIVAERAKREGVTISFLAYLRIGLPLTLMSLAFGTWWLA